MVTRAERRWVLRFGLIVAVMTAVPYVLGYAQQGSAWRYTGYLFGVEDGNSYTAKMLLGAAGHWLFRTPYTPYPQTGVLAFLPYLLLGKLSAPPGQHEQLIAMFQLFRVLATVLFGLATYDFLAVFIRTAGLRRLGTALAMLGGGLGWLAVVGLGGLWHSSPLGQVLPGMDLPLEFYSPETFGFLMVFGLPHLAVARALLLWGLRDYLLPPQAGAGWLRAARPGLLWLVMGLFQPLTVVSGWAVLAGHLALTGLLRWRQGRRAAQTEEQATPGVDSFRLYFWRAVRIGLLSAPVVAYTLLAFRLDPFLRGWEQQNRIVSPPVHHYLLAFGLVLPLAAWGVKSLWKGQTATAAGQGSEAGSVPLEPINLSREAGLLPLAWAAIFPLLAYAPYNLQRRLPDGIWVALLTLALVAIERGPKTSWQRWALRGLVGLGFLSTLLFSLAATFGVLQPAPPLYRPAGEVRGFEFLAAQADPDALVLAAYDTSNPLPAWAPLRTLVGLGPESLNLEELNRRITCFYSEACPPGERLALLDEFGVNYVWLGPAEKALGDWNPGRMAELEQIYHEGAYQIFRVR